MKRTLSTVAPPSVREQARGYMTSIVSHLTVFNVEFTLLDFEMYVQDEQIDIN